MRNFEQYTDRIARLYPPERAFDDNGDKILSQCVTLQVTDDCNLACFAAGTKILMSDFTYKNIEDICPGDEVMGFDENTPKGKQLKIKPTTVTHIFNRHDYVRKISTVDGEEIICTDEHPFLDGRRQWVRAEDINLQKKLTKFLGVSNYRIADTTDIDYMIGYVISCFLGDGHMSFFKHCVPVKNPKGYNSRLAVKDVEILERIKSYLPYLEITYVTHPFEISHKEHLYIDALYLGKESSLKLKSLIKNNWNINNTFNYYCGFLAGIIDTEGTVEKKSGYIRIFNSNIKIMEQCETALSALGFNYTYDKDKHGKNLTVKSLRILNPRNTTEVLKLQLTIQNAVNRKSYKTYYNSSSFERVDVKSIDKLRSYVSVYNFETTTHTYIANNFAVHNCNYCYQIHKGKRRMSLETAKKFIDLIISGEKGFSEYINPEKSPGLVIDFIGGEPFLEIELIDQMCTYIMDQLIEKQHPWAMKTMFSICSNGILYFDPKVQDFLNKWANRLSFSVTIDGNKELHDSCRVFPDGSPSYDLAVAAAKDWIGRGNYMGSKITIAPENIMHLYNAIVHMVELGYTEINANCVYEKGWKPIHATVLYEEMKRISDYFLERDFDFERDFFCSLYQENFFHPKQEEDLQNWCGGNGVMLACDPDGVLFPCLRYMESSLGNDQEPYSIGDIEIGIAQTPCDQCRVECLKKIDRRTQSTDECFYCPISEGCSWCFKAGTLITTPDGFKPIEDIKVGDNVISGDGNIQKVENISRRFTNDTLYLKATGMLPVYTTTEHPFLVRKFRRSGNNLIYGDPEWIKACDIKKSDKIALYVNKFGDVNADKNIAYLAGRYLGDGWKTTTTRGNCESTKYLMCCSYEESSVLENYFNSAKISVYKDKSNRTAQEYNIHSTNHSADNNNERLISIISECGKYAHGKYVPQEVFTWNKESIEYFLKGYFDADGHYDKKRETLKFTTVSLSLAQGISSLLLMLGKKCNWCVRKSTNDIIDGRQVNTHTTYELSFLVREPIRKYFEFDSQNNIMWVNVSEVSTNVEGYDVYNMSVENDHTYIANGAIVHNCTAYNYQVFGTPDARATYICVMHKARALGNLYFWNKYYRKHNMRKRMENHVPDDWALEIITEDELSLLKDLAKEDYE